MNINDVLEIQNKMHEEFVLAPKRTIAERFGFDPSKVTSRTVFLFGGCKSNTDGMPDFVRFNNFLEKGSVYMIEEPNMSSKYLINIELIEKRYYNLKCTGVWCALDSRLEKV